MTAVLLGRRSIIAWLGGAAAQMASPFPLGAQPAMRVIGFLHSSSPETNADYLAAFRKGLGDAGFVEGRNVTIEYRWAGGQNSRLPELAADLVRRRVDVIATPANTPAARAAKAATSTIPIVFSVGSDPVAMGLVTSLNRPGSNATGISFQTAEITAKRLGLLRDLAPGTSRFAALVNDKSAFAGAILKELQESAQSLGLSVDVLKASTTDQIDAAFQELASKPGSALLLTPDALFTARRKQLVELAARYALPTVYIQREFVELGGLVGYGPSFLDIFQQTGFYCGRVLKGESPASLPVMQPTKFELVVNLRTAKALGIAIPSTLVALANEVIE